MTTPIRKAKDPVRRPVFAFSIGSRHISLNSRPLTLALTSAMMVPVCVWNAKHEALVGTLYGTINHALSIAYAALFALAAMWFATGIRPSITRTKK